MRRFYLLLMALLGALATPAMAEPIARLTTHRATECAVPCPRAAVIFIHGITGSKETWGSPAGNLYWPTMLASDAALANDIDIYQVDYDSTLFSGPAAVAIETDIEKILDKLILEKQYSKVIFIAHSLGGILARTYLLHVKHTYGHAALSRFRMVITLGTPNEGSSLANLARLATDNEQIRVLRPIDVNDFQQLVNKSMREIQEKHEGCPSLRTFAAFEQKPVLLLGIVVEEASATRDAFARIGFQRNHMELPKPASLDDPVYTWATRLVAICVRSDADACPQPIQIASCPGGDFRPRPQ
jgi:pimeloyl-ACP methyl ester carboxylesterase